MLFRTRKIYCIFFLFYFLYSCSDEVKEDILLLSNLSADPHILAFSCVELHCEQIITTTIHVVGEHDLNIKRIVIEDEGASGFTLTTNVSPPFKAISKSSFQIYIKYIPPIHRTLDSTHLLITWNDSNNTDDRIDPGELSIPLIPRLVGQPVLSTIPETIRFSATSPNISQQSVLRIKNTGFGNIPINIDSIHIDESISEISIVEIPDQSLHFNEFMDIDFVFTPTEYTFIDTQIRIIPQDNTLNPTSVRVLATSQIDIGLQILPNNIHLNSIPAFEEYVVDIEILNKSIQTIQLKRIVSENEEITINSNSDIVLNALDSINFQITILPENLGEQSWSIPIYNNNDNLIDTIFLQAEVIHSILEVTPQILDFGNVPISFSPQKNILLHNAGNTVLTIESIDFIAGSSDTFNIIYEPTQPFILNANQEKILTIEFLPDFINTYEGSIAIRSDDINNSYVEVMLSGICSTCEDACILDSATPHCNNNRCEIDRCDTGFFDADLDSINGCECVQVGTDAGQTCDGIVHVGTVKDNVRDDQIMYTDQLIEENDVDWIKFFADDDLFNTFSVRVELSSPDPHIFMRVYRHVTNSSISECYFNEEQTVINNVFETTESEKADFIVSVERTPNTFAMCSNYTLALSNND